MDHLPILISVCGLVLSVLTFFVGRMSSAQTRGEQGGIIIAQLEQVAKDVREIKEDLSDLRQEQGSLRDRVTKVETKIELCYQHNGAEV